MNILTEIRTAKWLRACAEGYPTFRPVLLAGGSFWRTAISAILLSGTEMVPLALDSREGERLSINGIALAKVVEDSNERYTIQLRMRDESAPPLTLVFADDLFFMLVFAALTSAGIQCEFGFTDARLRELGAQKSRTTGAE